MQNLQFNKFIELTYVVEDTMQLPPMILLALVAAAVIAILIISCVKCFKYRKEHRPLDVFSTALKLLVLLVTRLFYNMEAFDDMVALGICGIAMLVVVVWDIKNYKIGYGLMFAVAHNFIGNILGFGAKYVLAIVVIAFAAYVVYEKFISDKKSFSLTEFVNRLKSI